MTGRQPKGCDVTRDEPEKSNTFLGLPRTEKEGISGWTTDQGRDRPDDGT
ncbi:hypothetical protein C8C99_1409 [Acidovorax sp. 107]|nr:hypothetical protein C8C99_1409 [Acidovorax sp. 107]